MTGLARHALRLLARSGYRSPSVLDRLNTAILAEGPRSRFLTLVYGEARRREDGGMQLPRLAGHPLPVLVRADGTVGPSAPR